MEEELQHFSHEHLLSLVDLQPKYNEDDSEEEDGDDHVVEDQHGGKCNMCDEHIYSFHLFYYQCKSCDYSLHTFCAQLPQTTENHPSHPGHTIYLRRRDRVLGLPCDMCLCNRGWKYRFSCGICKSSFDIICATMFQQKMNHPSHPHHQLQRMFKPMLSICNACGKDHKGTFYHCNTCSQVWLNLDCALLPKRLFIEKATSGNFTHSHPLTLAYSFPYNDQKAKYSPKCRICGGRFCSELWLYKCDKCRYYVHVDCATSMREPFMSIFLPPSLGKTRKNFKDDEHPNLHHFPFPDESYSLPRHHFLTLKANENKGEIIPNSCHSHKLTLFDTQTSLREKSFPLHDPMKRIQLLCDGCVRPITTLPFYTCSQDVQSCNFVLHEWCARLPSHVQDHPGHPEHTLFLLPNIPKKFFGVFNCNVCELPSNGFAYGCTICRYYVDVHCAFIPEEITHEAHPNHILSRINHLPNLKRNCNSCTMPSDSSIGFHCSSCDFYLHIKCALLLPKTIIHKYDKHPLSLRYRPVENHINKYFCEICEDEFNPERWFYHCTMCAQSMHSSCAPLKFDCNQSVYFYYTKLVFEFLNVKFGRIFEDHSHRMVFIQGTDDGMCIKCKYRLQYKMIFKCLECKVAFHFWCPSSPCMA